MQHDHFLDDIFLVLSAPFPLAGGGNKCQVEKVCHGATSPISNLVILVGV